MTKFRIKILGKSWTIRFMPYRKYKKKHGNDALGVTTGWKKRIDLCNRYTDIETVRHELTHGYFTELCLNPAELTQDNMEEVCCDLVAKHAGKILKQSLDVMKLYKKVK